MSQLFVEPSKIARARELARSAALGVQSFIDRHTTVAIERTVLRLLGISGTGQEGAPLANLIVDRLLEKGACAYLPFTANSAETTGPYDIGLKKVSMLYVVLSCYQHMLKKILSVNYKIFRQRFKENFAQANAYFLFDRRRIDAL